MNAELAFRDNTSARTPLHVAPQVEVRELGQDDLQQVIDLLSQDQVRNVNLLGRIKDHGISHPAHRGQFFGYFENGLLTGVALLGHIIALYGADSSLAHFARVTAEVKAKGHLILGPRAQVEAFWQHLSGYGRKTRLVREHRWYVCHQPRLAPERIELRRALLSELEVVANAQAEMVLEGSGVDPRLSDPEGFRLRVAERIERGRIWVKIEDHRVVFKVEVMGETEEAAYLEGVWTHPDYRGRGIAQRCMTELGHRLLRKHLAVSLLVEQENAAAIKVYEKVGFRQQEVYQARFLEPLNN